MDHGFDVSLMGASGTEMSSTVSNEKDEKVPA